VFEKVISASLVTPETWRCDWYAYVQSTSQTCNQAVVASPSLIAILDLVALVF
jgi:hypothetical protein